jgi:hypothetical protein
LVPDQVNYIGFAGTPWSVNAYKLVAVTTNICSDNSCYPALRAAGKTVFAGRVY